MSDEGMSDEMLAVVRKDISSSGDFGEVAAHVAAALITRLAAAERERDALREALLMLTAAVDFEVPPIIDRVQVTKRAKILQKCSDEARAIAWPNTARAALTANHSAPVVEE